MVGCWKMFIYKLNCNKVFLQEAHILHDFSSDFYGSMLRICILGYIRPEKSFNSLGKEQNFSQQSFYNFGQYFQRTLLLQLNLIFRLLSKN